MGEAALERWRRYRAVTAGEALPCALVDLDALESNTRALAAPLRASGKTLRVATKSVRCPDLVRRILELAAPVARGLMTYTAAETAFWVARAERDLLLAYPVARARDAALIAGANAGGATAAVVVDSVEHLELLAPAAREAGTRIPVVLDLDVSWRPLGSALHVGVRRSPLREARDVVALARRAAATEGLRFHGVMAYEAQIAGLPDSSPAVRAMKAASGRDVRRSRSAVDQALREAGLTPALFNGGGTGSLAACAGEAALTEVTAGSGFVDSHLFDGYRGLGLEPAAYFALAVVRRPSPDVVTCHGGGYVASGSAEKSRLPIPALPPGLSLLSLEGAGEVQTPLALARGASLDLGDPVFFRHAKAGELAEHFEEYLLVRGDRVEARAPTYRGLGQCFLG
ncbi:MAG: alanine racemase [Polyangiaceae bacterium]|jgi:D-serine deaminase-like pyridoxal phosphate-dependent protein